MLGDAIGFAADHLTSFNVNCRCVLVDAFNPHGLAQCLLEHGRAHDGIAFMALDHPVVREAVAALASQNVPVVTVVSDLSHSKRAALCRARQPRGRPYRCVTARTLHRPPRWHGGAGRGQPQLPRARRT